MDTYASVTPPAMTKAQQRTAELAKGVADNEFLGRTREGSRNGYAPRPERGDDKHQRLGDAWLREHQQQWDAAERWAVHNDDLKAARHAREQAERDAERQRIQAAADERTATARAELEDRLRRHFMQTAGTTEADWERRKEAILDRHFEDAALANDQAARRSSAAMFR